MWLAATSEEYESFTTAEVFTLEQRSTYSKTFGSKWAFKAKTDRNVVIVGYKARFATEEFLQVHVVDLGDTYGPVPEGSSIGAGGKPQLRDMPTRRQNDLSPVQRGRYDLRRAPGGNRQARQKQLKTSLPSTLNPVRPPSVSSGVQWNDPRVADKQRPLLMPVGLDAH